MNLLLRRMILLLALVPGLAAARDGYLWRHTGESLWAVSWEAAVPLTQLRAQLFPKWSPTGLQLEWRTGITSRLSAGVAFSYNHFKNEGTQGVSGKMNAVPVRGTIHYYVGPSALQPYFGVGIGVAWVEAALTGATATRRFAFCADPQLGLLWTVGNGVALNFIARYQFTTAAITFPEAPNISVKNAQWAALDVGIAFY